MLYLWLGLSLLMTPHYVSLLPSLKTSMMARTGRRLWHIVHGGLSTLGLVLIVMAMPDMPYIPLWPQQSQDILVLGMPLALWLFFSHFTQGWVRHHLRFPLFFAILIWSFLHMIVKGDIIMIVIFANFAVYAGIALIMKAITEPMADIRPSRQQDLKAAVLAFLSYIIIVETHMMIFGVGPDSFSSLFF